MSECRVGPLESLIGGLELLVPIEGAPWDVLPPGVHSTTFAEVATVFATNAKRRLLYRGLLRAATALRSAGYGIAGTVWLTMAIVLPIDALGLIALVIIAQRKTEGEWRWRLSGHWVRKKDTDGSF
jgi:hypothetical protein